MLVFQTRALMEVYVKQERTARLFATACEDIPGIAVKKVMNINKKKSEYIIISK